MHMLTLINQPRSLSNKLGPTLIHPVKHVVWFKHRVVTLVADKLERQWL